MNDEQDNPALLRDTIRRCLACEPPDAVFNARLVRRYFGPPAPTRLGIAMSLRRYMATRMLGHWESGGHGRCARRVRDDKPHRDWRRLSPALIAAVEDMPDSEASLVICESPYIIAGLLEKLAERGRTRLALDPQAGIPTGRPFRPDPVATAPEPSSGVAPEPETPSPKVSR